LIAAEKRSPIVSAKSKASFPPSTPAGLKNRKAIAAGRKTRLTGSARRKSFLTVKSRSAQANDTSKQAIITTNRKTATRWQA
jgi:hypothetical protein